MSTQEAPPPKEHYGYIIYPGNNATTIEKALKNRNVWTPLIEKDLLQACFVWKQQNLTPRIYDDFEDIVKYYPTRHVLLNHFQNNSIITTKSGLVRALKYYYSHQLALTDRPCHVHDIVPTTYTLRASKDDTEYRDFKERFHQLALKQPCKEKIPEKHCEANLWFVKPEAENQGKGIFVSNSWKQIEGFLAVKPVNSGWIVQKAIEKPLLYDGRKFDIRVWVLVTTQLEIYYYKTGYMRTSSSAYSTGTTNCEVHLTNNSKQKTFDAYSKFEEGNTLLLSELKSCIDRQGYNGQEKMAEIVERMKRIIVDTVLCARKSFGRGGRRNEFELFGYDFLVDEDFRVWLIEVNNNPYIGAPNAIMKQVIPQMINQMMEIVVDPLFPPYNYSPVEEKQFEILYKESSFKLSPIRVISTSTDTKFQSKRERTFSNPRSPTLNRVTQKSELYNVGKEEKALKPIYATPTETIKVLLENYFYTDFDPYITPVTLILTSPTLPQPSQVENNLTKIRLIANTRIAKILLQPKIFDLGCALLRQTTIPAPIRALVLEGFAHACKSPKARVTVIKELMPLLCDTMVGQEPPEPDYVSAVLKVMVASGGIVDRSVFIPGQSRENQVVRQLFIRSQCMKLMMFLKKKYPEVCPIEVSNFLENLSDRDWELFYESSGNKAKRSFSPKVNTVPEQLTRICINPSPTTDKKSLSARQKCEIKAFRTRRHSGFSQTRKD